MQTRLQEEALTVKQALFTDVIRRHSCNGQTYYTADGCGDRLFATGKIAVEAYREWRMRKQEAQRTA